MKGIGKSFSSTDVIKKLKEDGWYEIGCRGDHHYFKHDVKKGKITVPYPRKDIKPGIYASIMKQAGLK